MEPEVPSERAIARIKGDLQWLQESQCKQCLFDDAITLDYLVARDEVSDVLLTRILVYREGHLERGDKRAVTTSINTV